MEVEEILQNLKTIKSSLDLKGIKLIGIFGSFAKNSENIYSDIDIAIKKDKDYLKNFSPYNYFETISQLKIDLKKKFAKNIDIFDLDSNSPFLKDIEKELIYV